MILKRYVKVENGMVYENQTAIFDNVSKGLYHYQELKIGDELPLKPLLCLKKYGSDYTKITATADDVWELAQRGWLALPDTWEHPRVIFGIEESVGGGYYIELYGTDEAFYNADGDILSLYCPITENGQVVRYERVWERGKGE
jgi:hypothetical protein